MKNLINTVSFIIIFLLLILILSHQFFPNPILEEVYQYRIILMVAYVSLRILKYYMFKENNSVDE